MKKLFFRSVTFILAFLLLSGIVSPRAYADEVPSPEIINVISGDIDRDGTLSSADYILLRLHLLGVNTLLSPEVDIADVDRNGTVQADDFIALRLTLLGLRDSVRADITVEQEPVTEIPAEPIAVKHSYTNEEVGTLLADFTKYYGYSYEQIAVTSMGRKMYVLQIGRSDAKYTMFFEAAIHGKEYMNVAMILNLAEYYARHPDEVYNDRTLSEWLDDVCIYILPEGNPDGIAISQTLTATEEQQAMLAERGISEKKYEKYLKLWKANGRGVDIARNFPTSLWESADNGVVSPYYQLYKGERPASEIESQAYISFFNSHSFDVSISYHSYSEVVYYNTPNADEVTRKRAKSLAYTIGDYTGYEPYVSSSEAHIGYQDWANEQGVPAVTVETGVGASPLTDDQYEVIFRQNKYIFCVLAKWCADTYGR